MDPEEYHQLSDQDSAFCDSEGLCFQGIPLKPFSPQRQYAAQALGNRLLLGTAELSENGTYAGLFVDVAVCMYLCCCAKSEVMAAFRKPDRVLENALAWADENQIAAGSPAFTEACELYAKIFGALQKAQFRVVEDGKKNEEPEEAAADSAL